MAAKKNTVGDIQALLDKANNLLKKTDMQTKVAKREAKEKAVCSRCKTRKVYYRGLCEECTADDRNSKQATEVGKRWVSTDGYERIYVKGDTKYLQPVMYHRFRMAELLGRPLEEWENVGFKDGKKENTADENLILTVRAGFDLTKLTCSHCHLPYISLMAATASSNESNSPTIEPLD